MARGVCRHWRAWAALSSAVRCKLTFPHSASNAGRPPFFTAASSVARRPPSINSSASASFSKLRKNLPLLRDSFTDLTDSPAMELRSAKFLSATGMALSDCCRRTSSAFIGAGSCAKTLNENNSNRSDSRCLRIFFIARPWKNGRSFGDCVSEGIKRWSLIPLLVRRTNASVATCVLYSRAATTGRCSRINAVSSLAMCGPQANMPGSSGFF